MSPGALFHFGIQKEYEAQQGLGGILSCSVEQHSKGKRMIIENAGHVQPDCILGTQFLQDLVWERPKSKLDLNVVRNVPEPRFSISLLEQLFLTF